MCRGDQDSDINPPPGVASWQGLMGEAQVFSRSSKSGPATGDGGAQDGSGGGGSTWRMRAPRIWMSLHCEVCQQVEGTQPLGWPWMGQTCPGEEQGYCAVIRINP